MKRFCLFLLYCLLSTAFLAACDSPSPTPTPNLTSTPTPTPVPIIDGNYRPSINITHADYEAAVRLWQSKGISEYEITAREVSLRSENGYPDIYHVKGEQVVLLHSAMIGSVSPSHPLTTTHSELLIDNTVEGLFKLVDEATTDQYVRTGAQTVYNISFDPTFGYVTSYETYCEERATPVSGQYGLNCPSDTSVEIATSDFRALSQGTPLAIYTPEPSLTPAIYKPIINITHSQLETAMARWKAQGISEYEMTVKESSYSAANNVPMTYHVKGDDLAIIDGRDNAQTPGPTPTALHMSPTDVDDSVENLFKKVEQALRDTEQGSSINAQTIYAVQFDQNFGFVTYFVSYCQDMATPESGTVSYNCPTDFGTTIEVSDFKVLGSGTPVNPNAPTP